MRAGKQLGGFTLKPMIGQVFGLLTPFETCGVNSNGIYYYNCHCTCGVVYKVSGQRLRNGKVTKCLMCSKPKGDKHGSWKGIGLISKSWWSSHVERRTGIAYGRGTVTRKVDVTMEYMWDMFLKQKGKCALSGLELTFPKAGNQRKSGGTASVDRIDSDGEYTKDNVQWVHKDINKLKTDFKQERFIELCRLVAEHHVETMNEFTR